jgi:hypothetical protein
MLGNMSVSDPYNHRGRRCDPRQGADVVEFAPPPAEEVERVAEALRRNREAEWVERRQPQ